MLRQPPEHLMWIEQPFVMLHHPSISLVKGAPMGNRNRPRNNPSRTPDDNPVEWSCFLGDSYEVRALFGFYQKIRPSNMDMDKDMDMENQVLTQP